MVVELNLFNVRMTYPDYTPAERLCQVLFADFLEEILTQLKEKSNTRAETVPDMQCAFSSALSIISRSSRARQALARP